MIQGKNKTALLELKKDLDLVYHGAQVLEETRNIMLKEIVSILDEIEEERIKLNNAVQKSYQTLIKAYMESGEVRLKKESELPLFHGKLHVYETRFLGILTPKITYELEQVRSPLNISGETLFMEVARKSFIDTTSSILGLAEIEFKAWRLVKELKKTVIRVNAMQKYYIPEYDKAIKETTIALEEVEREFLLLLKLKQNI